METREQRLKRLTEGSPDEALLTLLNSHGTCFVDQELRQAAQHRCYRLLMLGIHAVAETWAEILFPGVKPLEAFKLYLENFVDGDELDRRFSTIAETLNDWRNLIAHQWLGSLGHRFNVDDSMKEGWKEENDVIYLNPIVYFECFCNRFDLSFKIINRISTAEDRERMKTIIMEKYLRR